MKKDLVNETKNLTRKASVTAEKIKKNKLLEEFKSFISRGNVLDLAVGVIIGGAFQSLVTSLTDNVISPILGCLTEVDFNSYNLKIGNLNLKYGAFLTDVINFIIMAFIVFLIVKVMNKILKSNETIEEEEIKEEVIPEDIKLLEEIRDLLKENSKR